MAAAPPAGGGGGPPGPVAAITSFSALYARPESDPYNGDYTDLLDTFRIQPAAAGWDADGVLGAVVSAPDTACNAYVGLYSENVAHHCCYDWRRRF